MPIEIDIKLRKKKPTAAQGQKAHCGPIDRRRKPDDGRRRLQKGGIRLFDAAQVKDGVGWKWNPFRYEPAYTHDDIPPTDQSGLNSLAAYMLSVESPSATFRPITNSIGDWANARLSLTAGDYQFAQADPYWSDANGLTVPAAEINDSGLSRIVLDIARHIPLKGDAAEENYEYFFTTAADPSAPHQPFSLSTKCDVFSIPAWEMWVARATNITLGTDSLFGFNWMFTPRYISDLSAYGGLVRYDSTISPSPPLYYSLSDMLTFAAYARSLEGMRGDSMATFSAAASAAVALATLPDLGGYTSPNLYIPVAMIVQGGVKYICWIHFLY